MTKLFSYVIDHDNGFAPNPFDGFCTLVWCKFGDKRRNLIEVAKEGDWIIGTGGVKKVSAGHGRIIYAMRVDEKPTLAEYYRDKRFRGRVDNLIEGSNRTDRFALVSSHFFYFGRNAIATVKVPTTYLNHPLEKSGPRYRSDFSEKFIEDFTKWLEHMYEVGMHGLPCGSAEPSSIKVRRKSQCKYPHSPAASAA